MFQRGDGGGDMKRFLLKVPMHMLNSNKSQGYRGKEDEEDDDGEE